MSQVTFEEFVESIPSFTTKQLEKIQSVTSFFLSNSSNDRSSGPSENEKDLIHALSKALENEGVRVNMNYTVLRGVTGWRKRVEDFNDFISHFEIKCNVKLRRVEYQTLLRLMFALLIRDLKEMNLRITPGVIVSNMGRIPDIFDRSFPGYMQSGLAYFVIRNNVRGRKRVSRK